MSTIKFLALSDTHLGENASLLNHDLGLEIFTENLKEIASGRKVETLLLLGDITDQVLAKQSTYSKSTKKFFGSLFSALDAGIDEIVFLFGNHDLNLFRTLFCEGLPYSRFSLHGLNTKNNPGGEALRKLLLPDQVDMKFSVANPIYVTQSEDRFFIFHHGHHIRKDIMKHWYMFRTFDVSGLDQSILSNEIEFGSPAARKVKTLEEFETCTFPFVTSFWKNIKDLNEPKSEKWYRWLHRVKHSLKPSERHVPVGHSDYLESPRLEPIDSYGKEMILERYIPAIARSPYVYLPKDKPVSFIYGDTHDGGYLEGKSYLENRRWDVNIFNTGAWITYEQGYHPPCLVYTYDPAEGEKMHEIGLGDECVNEAYNTTENLGTPEMTTVQKAFVNKIWELE